MYEYNLGIRFQTVAERHADAPALWLDAQSVVSYAELNGLANRRARWLLAQGVGARDVVCLSGAKSLDTFACMLACLKIGAAYSVLDPDSPVERLRRIVATCRPRLLVAERELLMHWAQGIDEAETMTAEKGEERSSALAAYADANLAETRGVTGASPAYIMFTSGSTGFPKGAVMTHANVLNLVGWSQATFAVTPADRLTNVNPLYFDNSVFDFYSALFTGACLVPFSPSRL